VKTFFMQVNIGGKNKGARAANRLLLTIINLKMGNQKP
jgi:hypothetical protein